VVIAFSCSCPATFLLNGASCACVHRQTYYICLPTWNKASENRYIIHPDIISLQVFSAIYFRGKTHQTARKSSKKRIERGTRRRGWRGQVSVDFVLASLPLSRGQLLADSAKHMVKVSLDDLYLILLA
jgi:hypothetical protein